MQKARQFAGIRPKAADGRAGSFPYEVWVAGKLLVEGIRFIIAQLEGKNAVGDEPTLHRANSAILESLFSLIRGGLDGWKHPSEWQFMVKVLHSGRNSAATSAVCKYHSGPKFVFEFPTTQTFWMKGPMVWFGERVRRWKMHSVKRRSCCAFAQSLKYIADKKGTHMSTGITAFTQVRC